MKYFRVFVWLVVIVSFVWLVLGISAKRDEVINNNYDACMDTYKANALPLADYLKDCLNK